MIRVLVWNEFKHERELDEIRKVYPDGIHECIKKFLCTNEDLSVKTATFDMPEHGLTEEALNNSDVLIMWCHALHDKFSDEVALRVQRYVLSGMGLILLHSAHFSKAAKLLLGTSMTLKWKHGESEKLWTVSPTHPIAKGVPEVINLPKEEMYGEPFDIPKPDDVVFAGWFSNGYVFRSGVTFTRGLGKIFYFQPGHEEYPVYYDENIRKIITNAVRFVAPQAERKELKCEEVK